MLSIKYKVLYVRNYYFSSPSSWAQLKFTFVNPSSNCISTTHLWFNLDTLKFFFSFVWDQFLTPSESPRGLPLSPPQHMAQCWVHTLCWQTTPQAHWLWGPETGLLSNFYSTVCDPVESHLAETAVLCIQSPASTLFLMAHAWYPHPHNASKGIRISLLGTHRSTETLPGSPLDFVEGMCCFVQSTFLYSIRKKSRENSFDPCAYSDAHCWLLLTHY